jgi:DNA repair photolyase
MPRDPAARTPRGLARHAAWNPSSRWISQEVAWDEPPPPAGLELIADQTQTIINPNRYPDMGFRWTVNPYRGCTHACAYCYARRHHELLGFGAGTDFERKILVKHQAPRLLETEFRAPSWKGERIVFSGVTDCYQRIERDLRLTRGCLEVCARFHNPVSIMTRSPLVARDIDLLAPLAAENAASVMVSVPVLDGPTVRALEPGAPPPAARLRAIAALSEAGIPVNLSLAPCIPGITERSMVDTLKAARAAGARRAWIGLLRLTPPVYEVFARRLRLELPLQAEATLARYARASAGEDGGAFQATLELFRLWRRRLGFEGESEDDGQRAWEDESNTPFRIPGSGRQMSLFSSPTPAKS